MRVRPEELHAYLCDPAADWPFSWSRAFGRKAPLAIELGFGGGEYLAWWASQHPDWNFIGIEKPPPCIVRAARHCTVNEIENVRLVAGDGRHLLRELFPTGSVHRVLMQFPMPWPKTKHAKHRVAGPHFSATLADVLEPGGEFELVTDQEWYGTEARAALAAHGAFEVSSLDSAPERPFRTRYEQKWLREGRAIYRLVARLAQPVPATRQCLAEPMLHVHLDQLPADAQMLALKGVAFRAGDLVAEVKELHVNDTSWLLHVVTADGDFSQKFHLNLVKRAEGGAMLTVADTPRPYLTKAVRFLVDSLAERLGAANSVDQA